MIEVLNLALPFFGLIFIGFACGKIKQIPDTALAWMNFFIVYVSLPALFYSILAKTPLEQLAKVDFVLATTLSTFVAFAVAFAIGMLIRGGRIDESTIAGLAGGYGNIGYMGPGLALLAFGEQAAVPVALIFCFENIMHFALAPSLMALSGAERASPGRVALEVGKKILLHPFIIATAIGVLAAALHFEAPVPLERLLETLARAAAPCALFAMGVTLALRPLKRVPRALGPIAALKLIVHPLLCYVVLSWFGDFQPVWIYSAVLLAALPTATNVFVIAQQYGVWVERASASILLTTVLSVGTVTALLYLMTTGLLPPDLFPQ